MTEKKKEKNRIKNNAVTIEKPKNAESPEVNEKVMNRQAYWFIGILLSLLVIFFLTYFFFQRLNNFNYRGLEFQTIREGKLIFYHTIFPVKTPAGENLNYHLYLRTDPRKNNVPIEGDIELNPRLTAFISINQTGLKAECTYAVIAIASLSQFLREAAGLEVKVAEPDKTIAEEINITHVNCTTHPINNVMLIQKSNETKITRYGNTNCYVFNVANCEIIPAVEKFQLETILRAKARKDIMK